MSMRINKQEIKTFIDSLPHDATWDDLIEELEMRRGIERGRADIAAGRYKSHAEIMAKYGLSE